MRTAALYDIHGNLPALEAVLAAVAGLGVERILVGGDVMPGPMPVQCLDALASCGIPVECIHGNGEIDVLAARQGGSIEHVPAAFREAIAWCASELDDAHARSVATWPRTRTLTVPDLGGVLFCHATPRDAREIFTRLTPDERLEPVLADVAAAVVVCGHTHMPFYRRVGSRRVANAGSVGMPFGRPGASWLLLREGSVEWQHTEYDRRAAATRMLATGFPGAATFVDRNVLEVPGEQEMEELLERTALR